MATGTGAAASRPLPAGAGEPTRGKPTAGNAGPRPGASCSQRRYLVNDPGRLRDELIQGYAATWPGLLRRTSEGLIVRRRRKRRGRVSLLIGNGIGHEPAMMGLVGHGLFDVNVPGGIFAAPPPAAIAHGIREADRGAGVLVCVSNHSGDVLNAEMAVELLGASGPACKIAVLGEDISSGNAANGGQRRGGPGLFFVWKITGAAAEAGYDLEGCARVAALASDRSGSLSATIRGTVNPETGQPTADVPDGQILLGTGVHGDGTGSLLDWTSARKLSCVMVDRLAAALSLGPDDRCLTMVNDAGAMSVAETTLVHMGVLQELHRRGVAVVGSWAGRYATTLATAGLAVGLCKVDDELLRLWRAPCHAPALSSWGSGPVG